MSASLDLHRREATRLAELERLGAVRPEADHVLQELVDDARKAFGTELCMTNLITSDAQYFRAWSGELPSDLVEARQDPRERSMCRYVVETEEPLVVEDFLSTERFKDQHFRARYGIRFYAGTPLVTSGGHAVGSLCLLDTQPKEFGEDRLLLLQAFAKAVVGRLEVLNALDLGRAAKESEHRILENITDAFFALDEGWRFTYLNREAERVLFRGREGLLGKNVWEEFPEAMDSAFYREYLRAVTEGVTVEFEEYYPPLETWFEVKAYPSEGGLSVYFRDVTERRRAREALKESEARHARIAANVPGMVYQFVLGPDGSVGFPYVSEGSREVYGLEPREIRRDASVVIDMIHPEDRPGFDRSVQRSAATLSPWRWEGRFILRSGEQKWLRGTSRPERQEGGEVLWDGLLIDVTERKRVEEALRNSERRLRGVLVQYGSDVIMILEADGTIRYQSPAVERVLGYRPGELYGESPLEYLHPLDVERAPDELGRILKEPGLHEPVEYRFRCKDGSWRWLEGIGNNLLDDPDVRGVVVTSRDVTERKRAEEALRKSEARSRAILDASPDLMFVYGRDGTYLDIQASRAGKLYLPREELIGRKLDDVLPPEVAQPFLRQIARALDTQETQVVEYRLEVPDGVLDFEAYLAASGPDEVLCVARDVTERNLGERRLREAEGKYRTLVEQVPAIVYVDTLEDVGYAEYTSPQAEAVLGYPMEAWDADPLFWTKLMYPADRERVMAENERANALAEPLVLEYRMVCHDGRVVWLHDHSVVLRDGEGRPWRRQGVMLDVTEREEAEEALRLSETNLAAAQAIARLGSWEITVGAGVARWSDELYRIHGFEPQSFLPTEDAFLQLIHPDDREIVEGYFRAPFGDDGPDAIECRIVRPEGEVRVVQNRREARFDETGRLVKINGTVQDVTEEKEAEKKLREAQERYRILVEQIPAVTYVDRATDGPDEPLYTSPQIEELLGYTPEEWLEGRLWPERLHPDDRERVLAADERFEAGGEPFGEEYRLIAKDGRVVWVREEAALVRGEGDEPLYWQGILLDVTERRRWEERLREAEEKYRMLVENIPAVAYTQEVQHNNFISYMGPQIEALLGYPAQEYVSDPELWIGLIHPDDRERVLAEDERTDETGEPFRVEYRKIARDGRVVWVRDEAVLVEDSAGRPRFWQGVMTDITERKRAEEALRESEQRLRKLADAAFEGIIIHDGREILEANKAYAAMHGREISEIVGSPALERVAPEYRTLVRQHILSGHEEPYESAEIKKDGTRIDVEIRGKALSYRGRTVRVAAVRDVTERKRAEAALRESEEHFRAAFENAPTGVALVDSNNNRYLRANRTLCEMLGYEEGELLGKSTFELTHPEDLAKSRARTERMLEEGEPEGSNLEKRYVRKDGSVMWALSSVSLIKDSAGNPEHFVSQLQDLTERKRFEEALGQSEERYRAVVEQTAEGIYLLDVETRRVLEANAAFGELLGYSPEELQEITAYDFVTQSLEEIEGDIRRTLKEGRRFVGERQYRRKDGSPVDVEVNVSVIHYGGRDVVCAAVRDVTERKQAEAALRRSEERFRSVVQNASDIILIMEAGGTVRYVSPAVEQVLGYKPEDVIGKDNFTPVHPDDVAQAQNFITDAMNTPGSTSVAELRLQHVDGSWRRVESRCTSLLDDPAVDGIVINSRDVTERRRFEEELRLRNRAIEASNDGVVITDPNQPGNPMVYVNAAFEHMSGYPAEELVGRNCRMLQGSDRDQPTLDELRAAVSEGREYRGVLRNYRKDGSLFWNELHIAPVFEGGGA